MSDSGKPVLWHIPVSHFSEKARWALAYKGIEHDRRAPPPGAHMIVAMALTRSGHHTFPVLSIDGRTIGDSAEIIDVLERRQPEPALYPVDAEQRRRALELQRWFDTELGPPIRLVAWHELRADPQRMGEFSVRMLPPPFARLPGSERIARGIASTFVQLRFRVADPVDADAARAAVLAAFDRLERELESNGGDYLVGDSFSVADLTAASLFYPLVDPPEGPAALPDPPPRLAEFQAGQRERPGFRWVEEMFRRHRRGPGAGSSA